MPIQLLFPYIEKVRHDLGLPDEQKAVVIFDVFRAHQCDSFLSKLRDGGIIPVPACCTSELQPLDLSDSMGITKTI